LAGGQASRFGSAHGQRWPWTSVDTCGAPLRGASPSEQIRQVDTAATGGRPPSRDRDHGDLVKGSDLRRKEARSSRHGERKEGVQVAAVRVLPCLNHVLSGPVQVND
jgi:hypothetical protein